MNDINPAITEFQLALAYRETEELYQVGICAVQGQVVEFTGPDRWLVETMTPEDPDQFRIWRVGADREWFGPRVDLILVLIKRLDTVILDWREAETPPEWVEQTQRSRAALLVAQRKAQSTGDR